MPTTEAHGSLRQALWRSLDEIVDPCSRAMGAPAGLVALGLVRKVELEERPGAGAHVLVTLCITEPGCLMAAVFQEAARSRLEMLPGVARVDVEVDHGHVWDPEQMEPGYRRRLLRLRAERLASMKAQRLPSGG